MSKIYSRSKGPVRTTSTSLNTPSKATSGTEKRGPVRTSEKGTASKDHTTGPAGRSPGAGSTTKRGVRTIENTTKN
jgi:hypothetical protein